MKYQLKFKYQRNSTNFGHRHADNKTNLQQRGISLTSSTPVSAQQDVPPSGSVTDEGIVPAQFLRADGLIVCTAFHKDFRTKYIGL